MEIAGSIAVAVHVRLRILEEIPYNDGRQKHPKQ